MAAAVVDDGGTIIQVFMRERDSLLVKTGEVLRLLEKGFMNLNVEEDLSDEELSMIFNVRKELHVIKIKDSWLYVCHPKLKPEEIVKHVNWAMEVAKRICDKGKDPDHQEGMLVTRSVNWRRKYPSWEVLSKAQLADECVPV